MSITLKSVLFRDNIVLYEGQIESLRRFKDDVKEVASGLRMWYHYR